MCDEADQAQDFCDTFTAAALQRQLAQRPTQPGLAACVDCEEPISPARQRLGAIRCIECQRDEEVRAHRATAH